MARYITVYAAVMLDRKDMFRAVLLVDRPVVDKLVQKTVFARVDDLLSVGDGLLVIVTLVELAFLGARLRPLKINFREQSGCGR